MKQIDIPIGAKIKYHGKRGVCVEGGCCGRCIIYDCDKLACQAQTRRDGKEVSFKEIQEETDEKD